MQSFYVLGDSKYAKQSRGNASINVPAGASAAIAMRALHSGSINIDVGENARLLISCIDDSLDESHSITVDAHAHENSSYVHTFNFRSNNIAFNCTASVRSSARCALNAILNHAGSFNGDICVDAFRGSKTLLNALVKPAGAKSKSMLNMKTIHNADNAYNRITCHGSLAGASSCSLIGEICIKEGLKGIDSAFDARFMRRGNSSAVHILPVLRIHSRDVRSGHSASVVNISDDALTYLQSRGLTEEQSFKLVENGMVSSMLNRMGEAFEL